MEKETWDSVCSIYDSELACSKFISILKNAINLSTKEITKELKYKKLKPWITIGIMKSINTRDKLKKKLKNTNNTELLDNYKKYRNKLNNIIKNSKLNYYNTLLADANSDGKKHEK